MLRLRKSKVESAKSEYRAKWRLTIGDGIIPLLACLQPQVDVVRGIQAMRHPLVVLRPLAAGHVQVHVMRVGAAERARHIRLHGRAQRHRILAIVRVHVRIEAGRCVVRRGVNGDVDVPLIPDAGRDDGRRNVTGSLRRESRCLRGVDVGRQRQQCGLRIFLFRRNVQIFGIFNAQLATHCTDTQ